MRPTPLEWDVLRAFHAEFGRFGFPPPDQIGVSGRKNTGAGRFTDLATSATVSFQSPWCDLSVVIEMEGLDHGLGALVFLDDGRPVLLELFTHVGDWDGEERAWRLVRSPEASDA